MQLERKSSIDSEPRTLNLDYAREAALYIMNTKSIEEARRIFTEGLQPVVGAKHKGNVAVFDSGEEGNNFATHFKLPPPLTELREVVSAPF